MTTQMLPAFPVDDEALVRLEAALDGDGTGSRLFPYLEELSGPEVKGSPRYSTHDVIRALIGRVRAQAETIETTITKVREVDEALARLQSAQPKDG